MATNVTPQVKGLLGLNPIGFHHISYNEWGAEKTQNTLICVHGLTRNSHDFDALAQQLSLKTRVICPDIVGRGQSDRFSNPKLYGFPQYLNDMTALIARLNVTQLDWLGTSMGGLIGMFLAIQPNSPIKRLILNDVGPYIPAAALRRIGRYAKSPPSFQARKDAEIYIRRIYAPFGLLSDKQWQHITKHSIRQVENTYILDYDPAVIQNLRFKIRSINLWPVWEKVKCPVLVIRGENSDILTVKTLTQMQGTCPNLEVLTVKDAGHAPALMDLAQINVIKAWLSKTRK
ncbi:MAG: alpha/beta hydrolase [Alphaproteobacteria bacterium]|nr:alpha/beta hydrolase [Alphaproteobacteria bacterium]